MPEPGWGLRDHLRAAAIGLVLLAQALDATPLPELRESHLRNPVAWDEIERWSGLLTDAGLPTSPEELLQFGLGLGEGSRAFRKHLLRPWWPFRRLTGTGQSWGLFAYPDPYAGRLTVNGRAAGQPFTFRKGNFVYMAWGGVEVLGARSRRPILAAVRFDGSGYVSERWAVEP